MLDIALLLFLQVIYEDGDVENLKLNKERWEFLKVAFVFVRHFYLYH
jgi:hypothetical protein